MSQVGQGHTCLGSRSAEFGDDCVGSPVRIPIARVCFFDILIKHVCLLFSNLHSGPTVILTGHIQR